MSISRVPKIDPHIDIADLYKEFNYSQDDFLSKKDLPVTFTKLKDANISIVGATLYFDHSFVQTSFKDGVLAFYKWYEELFSKDERLYNFKRFSDIENNENKIGFFYTIEGFECLKTPDDFNQFYNLGVRSYGLTWCGDNDYACGRHTEDDTGLSEKGLEVLEEMNKKPLIIDIAHLSEKSVLDVAKVFDGMLVTTHGNVRSVYDTTHNIKDAEIDIIVDRGGVISLFPLAEDTGKLGTYEELYNHLEYVVNKWGIDYVAVSSDIYPIDEYPFLEGSTDVSVLSGFEDFLLKKMSQEDVKKVFYDNWLRVLSCLK